MRSAAVIDTNVVVSGILTRESGSPTARILDGMLAGRFHFLISLALLAEYRDVLLRPRIRRRHQLSEPEVDRLLTELAANGAFVETSSAGGEAGDEHLRRILEVESSAVLITGDRLLAEDLGKRARSPREFADAELEG